MSRAEKFSGEYGGKVHCSVCDASTEASPRDEKVHEFFTVGCAYCQWLDIKELRDKLAAVTKQRDALAQAIDVKRTLTVTERTK